MQTFSLKCLVVLKRLLYYLNKKYGIPCPRKNSSWQIQKKRFGYYPEQPNPSEQMEKILYTATATLSW